MTTTKNDFMKKVLIVIGMISFSGSMLAQDFSKDMATAKSSYNAGKLEETHFALLQAMQARTFFIGTCCHVSTRPRI
jgi:hypothetical protein